VFPNLLREEYHVTSPEDWAYNCIAHAAGRDDAPWWPDEEPVEGVYWPDGAPREQTLGAFILAYQTLGYVSCENGAHEPGYQKIAISLAADGEPTHAAVQLPSGAWSSKLGDWEDIEHNTLGALEGNQSAPAYGVATSYLKRALSASTVPPQGASDSPPTAPQPP
jgi:hypothetical protein